MRDGYQNTYTLLKDGRKITLAPLAPHQITKPKPKPKEDPKGGEMLLPLLEPTLLSSHQEFKSLKEMILLTPPQDEAKSPLHPLAIQLLKEFSHVFPEDIPPDLPPQRSIQHHIDLVSRAILPNKPAYRMNPKDTFEIQRQVEELISKGLVRESFESLCHTRPSFTQEGWLHENVCR